MKKKAINELLLIMLKSMVVSVVTAGFLDNLKNLGFKHATESGISISIDDIIILRKRG
jgi:DNA-directed RNA polymerase subunit beta'